MVDKLKSSVLLKNVAVGALLGLLTGLLYGGLTWILILTAVGAVVGLAIHAIDKALYKPIAEGGNPQTVTLIAVIVLFVVGALLAAVIWAVT
jgi:hypothetical protein